MTLLMMPLRINNTVTLKKSIVKEDSMIFGQIKITILVDLVF